MFATIKMEKFSEITLKTEQKSEKETNSLLASVSLSNTKFGEVKNSCHFLCLQLGGKRIISCKINLVDVNK
jgi:hypothetical protein